VWAILVGLVLLSSLWGTLRVSHRQTDPMELLGDVAQVEARFGPFRFSANLDTRSVHGLRRTNHRLRNHFGCT
jgi:hypothetical protein